MTRELFTLTIAEALVGSADAGFDHDWKTRGGGRRLALPALVVGAGKGARTHFLEFFTVNIRNPNTRAAYSRTAVEFLRWSEGQGIGGLDEIRPVHVAAYVEGL